MNFKDYKLNCLPSPNDERDYNIAMFATSPTAFPNTFQVWTSAVKDQGKVGSCVAHSAAEIKEAIEYGQTKFKDMFSVGFIYANRESIDYQGEGMYPREALKNLQKCGTTLLKDFPQNLEYPQVKALLEEDKTKLMLLAFPWRISTYARLNTPSDIKTALMATNTPVMIALSVYEEFYNPDSTGFVKAPAKGQTSQGGHALMLYGWTDKGWLVQNSWGTGYGRAGKIILDYNYKLDEAWSVVDNIIEEKKDMFTDLKEHWAKPYIEKLAEMDIVGGYPDGTFKPDQQITRAEVACMLAKLIDKTKA